MVAAEGGRVSLLARNKERLKETLSSMKGEGHQYYICDLTSDDQIMAVVGKLDALDGVVFCAGVTTMYL